MTFPCSIVGCETGNEPLTKQSLIALATSSNNAIYRNSWLKDGTAMASAAADADYVVESLYDASGRRLNFQHVTAAEADAAQYYAKVYPIGKLIFEIEEDADAGAIAAAVESGGYYADLVVAAADDLSQEDRIPFGEPTVNILLDSSSANASSSGLLVEILGLSPSEDRVYGASTKRRWLIKVIDACATYTQ